MNIIAIPAITKAPPIAPATGPITLVLFASDSLAAIVEFVPDGLIVGLKKIWGCRVGERVGFDVGDFVGFFVGFDVGDFVGFDVGDLVGLAVGFDVGDLVGLAVGFDVGDLVGLAVGFDVGD